MSQFSKLVQLGQIPIKTDALILPPETQMTKYQAYDVPSGLLPISWAFFRRWKWILVCSALAGIAVGVLPSLLFSPLYHVKTTLEIQDLNDNFLNVKEVLPSSDTGGPSNLFGDIQTQIQILESDSLLKPVQGKVPALADRQGAKLKPVALFWPMTLLHLGPSRDEYLGEESRRLYESVKENVRGIGQTRIVELTASSTNPQLAADFLNQVATAYIDQNIRSRWEMSQHTSQALARLLDEAQAKLRASETAMQNYAQSNGLVFTSSSSNGDNKNVVEQGLSDVQGELSRAQAARIAAQSRYEMLKRSLTEPEWPGLNTELDGTTQNSLRVYQDKLADLRQQRADLATTFTADYGKVKRLDSQIKSIEQTIKQEKEDELRRAEHETHQAERRESLLRAQYDRQSALVSDTARRSIQYNILAREVEGNRQVYDEMLKQVRAAAVATAIPSSNIRVVDPAVPLDRKYFPKLTLNCACGLIVGSFFGLFLAYTRERKDTSFRELGDAVQYLAVPELGVVLQDRNGGGLLSSAQLKSGSNGLGLGKNGKGQARQIGQLRNLWRIAVFQHQSGGESPIALVESCRAVVTSLLLSGRNGSAPPRLVAVSSPGPGEGKTTIVANAGLILAALGRRVLLIDADLRRGRLPRIFGLSSGQGLSALLQSASVGMADLDAYIQKTSIPSLSILSGGPSPALCANLLHSPEFVELLDRLKAKYDIVLIDAPPVLQVADARIIGRLSDGVVVVVRAGRTSRDAAFAACQRLQTDGTRILGLILNDWDPNSSTHSYYSEYSGATA